MDRIRASAAWKKAFLAVASYDPNVDGVSLEELAEMMGCSTDEAEERYLKHCDASVQKFKVGDRVIAEPVPGYRVEGTVTYAGDDGAVEVMEDSGSGGMYPQRMISAAPKKDRKDEGEKPPVADTCDDCGADVAACGCKDVARAEHVDQIPGGKADDAEPADFDKRQIEKGIKHELEHTTDRSLAEEIAMDHLAEDPAYYDTLDKVEKKADPIVRDDNPGKGREIGKPQSLVDPGMPGKPQPRYELKNAPKADMEPGPEMAALLEQFAQDVFQKRLDELTYQELHKLRDILQSPAAPEPKIHEISAVDPDQLPWLSNSWGETTLDQIEKRLEEMGISQYQASLNSSDSKTLDLAFEEEGGNVLYPPWSAEQLLRVVQVLGDSDSEHAQDLRQGILQTLRIEEI